jgi:hypothetical protein
MVKRKNGKCGICIDFTSINKDSPKHNFPLLRIDKIVDFAVGCEVMSFFIASLITIKFTREIRTRPRQGS